MLTPRKDESPVHYWISLWPTAPLFGVKWRFEGVIPAAPLFNPFDAMTRAAKAGAARAKVSAAAQDSAAVDTLDEAVETVLEGAEAALDTAVGASQMLADEAGAFVDELDEADESDEGDAGGDAVASPGNLYAERPPAVDDLKQIKGVGPKLEAMLNDMGIWRLDQIAAFTPENLAWVDAQLTSFRGRPLRDDWVAQAKALL